MRRRQGTAEWRLHQAEQSTAIVASYEMSPELHGLCADVEGAQLAQRIRREVIDGMHREDLLRRIRERLGSTLPQAHGRYTRRAYLELQGRRHAPVRRGATTPN